MNSNKLLALATPHKDDINHVESILNTFPERWAYGFAKRYHGLKTSKGRKAANLYLIEKKEQVKPHQIGLASNDEDICSAAKAKAARYWEKLAIVKDHERAYHEIKAEIELLGVKAPKAGKTPNYKALCNRFACPIWWRRALRVAVGRHIEHEAIKNGFVGFGAAYISNESLGRRRQQNRRNRQTLEWIMAENDDGYQASLAELSAAGVSNPENRKNELMTRIRGLEEEAKRKGLVCEFLTITAPSKCHATSGGRRNPKYNGASPREAQEHLNKTWQKIRAAYGREGIEPTGFRVAEPHKDACPHWHMMLFIKRSEIQTLRAIVKSYALEVDGGEKGAEKHRFTAVSIDPNKGSASGYIAKYIAKSVSMEGIEDFERDGKSAAEGLERSVAWAALWGIRQFQEVGSQVITKWRELRRIREAEGLPEVVAVLWRSADTGEYGQFLKEIIKRKVSLIRETEAEKPLYKNQMQPNDKGVFSMQTVQTSELITGIFNRYGEQVTGAVKGVIVDGVEILTRFSKWTFSYKGEPEKEITSSSNHEPEVTTNYQAVSIKRKGNKLARFFRACGGVKSSPFFLLSKRSAQLGLV